MIVTIARFLISLNLDHTRPVSPNAIGIERKKGTAVQKCMKLKSSEKIPIPINRIAEPANIRSVNLDGRSLTCFMSDRMKSRIQLPEMMSPLLKIIALTI